jgi:hypothetical protein
MRPAIFMAVESEQVLRCWQESQRLSQLFSFDGVEISFMLSHPKCLHADGKKEFGNDQFPKV